MADDVVKDELRSAIEARKELDEEMEPAIIDVFVARVASRSSPAAREVGEGLPLQWYYHGMRTTIDKAGRLVIPKQLRDEVGLAPGEVEVTVSGAGLRVEPLAGESLHERDGRLVIPAGGAAIDDELVRSLRDAGQR